MTKEIIVKKIITLITKAHYLAKRIGINNILQPGLVKEMIIADKLGHNLIVSKRDADACDKSDPNIKYEYLSCKEGGTGQLDRMFKKPEEKRKESLKRITRNNKIYYAVFYKSDQIKVKEIYAIEPDILLQETKRQLDRSSNDISHVSFPITWVKEHGQLVYQNGSLIK